MSRCTARPPSGFMTFRTLMLSQETRFFSVCSEGRQATERTFVICECVGD